jgi:integrase/recombinase XerC
MYKLQTIKEPQSIIQSQRITNDLLDKFIAFVDGTPKTLETYFRALKQFFKYINDNNICQPQRADILAFREHLKTFCKPSTVQGYIIAVRLFFRWTSSEGLYPNIAEHIKGAKLHKGYKKDYLTSTQVKTVFNNVSKEDLKGKRDYAILALMTTGGLRTIEVVRANFEDLRTLGDNEVLYIQGKGREEKTEYIKIPLQVSQAIRDYIKALGHTIEAKEPLFSSISNHGKGGRMTTRSVSRIVKNRFINSGYNSERLTAHSLRHTAITLSLLGGATLQEAQQFARHSNLSTTQIYAHNLERANNKCEATIAQAIF